MSEEKQDYVVEALDLLRGEPSIEISRPHKTIVRQGGELQEVERAAFVKISTSFKAELNQISGDALKVWLFIALSINRKTEQAHPGLRTIADAVGLAVNTVRKAIAELESHHLIAVNRGLARYNIYEVPEYVSANRSEPTVSNRDTVPETVSNGDTTVSKSAETVSPSVIHNQKNQKNQKSGDAIDGMMFYGKQAQEQGSDKIEELFQEMERGLHVNITRTTANQAAAKRIIKDGRSFGQWLTWCISDEWRAAHLYLYADLDKVWRDFPQAFSETTGYNPQGLSLS